MIKWISKIGDKHTLPCGCFVQRGQPVDTIKTPNGTRTVYEVINKPCRACDDYREKRSRLAEEAYAGLKEQGRDPKAQGDAGILVSQCLLRLVDQGMAV